MWIDFPLRVYASLCVKLGYLCKCVCLSCFSGGYALILDINLARNSLEKLLTYLKESAFLDRVATSNFKVGRTGVANILEAAGGAVCCSSDA